MSVFPLGERVLLYVWKVVRVVIQGVCRRWCMLAAWQSAENGPRTAVSRAFVCLCLTRRLLVHGSTASTQLAKEQSGHYQPYLFPTLPWLTDTQGQTVAGLSRSALLGDSGAGGSTGRSIKGRGNTLAVDKHQHNSVWRWLPQRWERTGVHCQWWQRRGGVRHHGTTEKPPQTELQSHNTPFIFCVTVTVCLEHPFRYT